MTEKSVVAVAVVLFGILPAKGGVSVESDVA